MIDGNSPGAFFNGIAANDSTGRQVNMEDGSIFITDDQSAVIQSIDGDSDRMFIYRDKRGLPICKINDCDRVILLIHNCGNMCLRIDVYGPGFLAYANKTCYLERSQVYYRHTSVFFIYDQGKIKFRVYSDMLGMFSHGQSFYHPPIVQVDD